MADIRCPMCGKPNPSELDTCQFCQARLKPLTIPPQGETVPEEEMQAGGESVTDWLSSLRTSGDEAEINQVSDDDSGSLSGSEMPDWLQGLRGESETDSSDLPAEPAGEGLSLPGESLYSLEEAASSEDEWSLSARPPDHDYIPDWLAQSGSEQESQALSLEETLGLEEAKSEAEEGEPDWLRNIRIKYQEDLGESPLEDALPAAAGLPEWLAETKPEEPVVPQEPEVPSDNVSGWLARIRRTEALEEAGQAPPVPEGSAPLSESTEAGQAESTSAVPPEESRESTEVPAQEGEIPDWLTGLVVGKAAASALEPVETDAEGLPDWLADLDKSASQAPGVIVPFGEEEPGLTFDWLQEQVRADQGMSVTEPAGGVAEADAGKVSPFEGDLSDFLEEEYLAAGEIESQQEPVVEVGEDLPAAELPNWLEAMRPLGAAALGAAAMGDVDAQIESSGPLAGLRGVVPAEPDIARLKKPPTYALRLQVTDTQQTNATILEELLKAEGSTRPVTGKPAITSQHVWRAIIFLVLVAIIFWKAFTGARDFPLPAMLPEVLDASAAIDSLPQYPVVLLAVDYEPGYAGELNAASSAMIDHLFLKGAYLALVSTSPTGVALGEELLQKVGRSKGFEYQQISQYANLGFIPGGPTGLLAFADAPRRITPYALDVNSTYVWGQSPMQNIQSISDFDLVAVMTEDSDKARAWIEQVQPKLGTTPLVMVLSAQAEPMVRPYYQSNPRIVAGMVAGLVGGGSYESAHPDLLNGNGPARQYWDAFSLGILALLALISIGLIVDLSYGAIKDRKREDGSANP